VPANSASPGQNRQRTCFPSALVHYVSPSLPPVIHRRPAGGLVPPLNPAHVPLPPGAGSSTGARSGPRGGEPLPPVVTSGEPLPPVVTSARRRPSVGPRTLVDRACSPLTLVDRACSPVSSEPCWVWVSRSRLKSLLNCKEPTEIPIELQAPDCSPCLKPERTPY
jgi:hypothetical protein